MTETGDETSQVSSFDDWWTWLPVTKRGTREEGGVTLGEDNILSFRINELEFP